MTPATSARGRLVPAADAQSLLGSGSRLLAPALVALLLLAALATGLGHVPGTGMRVSGTMVVGAAAGAIALIVILTRLEYGVLLLPPVAVLVPYSIGTGTESMIPAAMILAGLLLVLWLGRAIIRGDATIAAPSVALPLVAFALTSVLATLYSDVDRHPLVWVPTTWTRIQIGGVSLFLLSAAVWLVTSNALRELRWIKWLVWSFIAIGGLTILVFYARGGQDVPSTSIGGLFSFWVMALGFGQILFNRRLPRLAQAAIALIVLAWLFRRLTESAWISGWLPACIALLIVALAHSRRTFALMLLVVAVIGALNFDAFYQAEVNGDDAEGNFLRLELWEQNLDVTKDHLLLGTGVVGYAPYYLAFFPGRALSTHSNLLDIFAETGLVGSALFVWFVVAAFRGALAARRRWPTGFGAGVVNGVLGGLVGMVVAMAFGDWVIPFVYNQTIAGFRYTVHSWLFLGVIAAMQRIEPDPDQ